MARCESLLARVSSSPNNTRFEDALALAACWGFLPRKSRGGGSHVVLRREGYPGHLNFQNAGGKAKPYQVRQLLAAIERLRE